MAVLWHNELVGLTVSIYEKDEVVAELYWRESAAERVT